MTKRSETRGDHRSDQCTSILDTASTFASVADSSCVLIKSHRETERSFIYSNQQNLIYAKKYRLHLPQSALREVGDIRSSNVIDDDERIADDFLANDGSRSLILRQAVGSDHDRVSGVVGERTLLRMNGETPAPGRRVQVGAVWRHTHIFDNFVLLPADFVEQQQMAVLAANALAVDQPLNALLTSESLGRRRTRRNDGFALLQTLRIVQQCEIAMRRR